MTIPVIIKRFLIQFLIKIMHLSPVNVIFILFLEIVKKLHFSKDTKQTSLSISTKLLCNDSDVSQR